MLRTGTRAWPLALIAGMGFGGSALAIRAAHVQTGAATSSWPLLGQPSTYLVIGYWTVGIISYTTRAVPRRHRRRDRGVPGHPGAGAGHGRHRAARRPGARRAPWIWVLVLGLAAAVAGTVLLAKAPPLRPPRVR